MNHRQRISLRSAALVFCLALFTPGSLAQIPAGLDAVLGRWDITVQGSDGASYPSWLEVRLRKEGELMASLVGRFGSVRYASRAEFGNGQLTVVVPAQYERAPKELVFTATIANDKLSGTTQDESGATVPWTGVRAPALVPGKSVVWGKPVALFNGKNLTGWRQRNNAHPACWRVVEGVLTNQTPCSDLISEEKFMDFKAQIEFQVPARGNSGVYLRGRYEVQISDIAGQVVDALRMGAVYGFLKPVVNAAKAPGEWQTMEITLLGRKVTVVLNGQTIIDHETIPGITGGALDSDEATPGPLMLQGDHTKILYRKIVVTPAKPTSLESR